MKKKSSASSKPQTIVVAGANGFMGNKLVAEALCARYAVIALARRSNGESAQERVLRELAENLSGKEYKTLTPNLVIYDYDITKPDLGLPVPVIDEINATASSVFNCVGDTNFFPKNVDQLFTINVDGPVHLITTLCKQGALFNHISTAYVAGDRSGTIYESDLDKGQEFKNHYEKSKFVGECKVAEICTQRGVPYAVFRPSIVIRRHSLHGKIPNLNHFYSFIELIDILRQDAQNQTRAGKKDVLEVPVRFLGMKQSKLNFVDLEYATLAMLHIAATAKETNKTYHLVNPSPMTNQEFITTIMKLYRIKGFEIIEDKKDFVSLNFRERLIRRGLANYISYFFVNPHFDDSNTRTALAGTAIRCPDFNLEYIAEATGHFA